MAGYGATRDGRPLLSLGRPVPLRPPRRTPHRGRSGLSLRPRSQVRRPAAPQSRTKGTVPPSALGVRRVSVSDMRTAGLSLSVRARWACVGLAIHTRGIPFQEMSADNGLGSRIDAMSLKSPTGGECFIHPRRLPPAPRRDLGRVLWVRVLCLRLRARLLGRASREHFGKRDHGGPYARSARDRPSAASRPARRDRFLSRVYRWPTWTWRAKSCA